MDNNENIGRGRGRGRARPNPECFHNQNIRSADRSSSSHTQRGANSSALLSRRMGDINLGSSEQHTTKPQRGKKYLLQSESVATRPESCTDKSGTSGKKVMLQANYFELNTLKDWSLYQYRVDFLPDEERTSARKALFHEAYRNILKSYLFEGTTLYLTESLEDSKCNAFVNVPGEINKTIKITIRKVGIVSSCDHNSIQVFNVLLRKCFRYLKFQLVGRNYYDANRNVKLFEQKLELWPGYLTSIRQYERQLLLCCELSHKFMRKETLLNVLEEYKKKFPEEYETPFEAFVLGSIVLTEYNNRTYTITDVDWTKTPQSKFEKQDGSEIRYIDYYKQRYQLKVNSQDQPLLLTKSKERDKRAGLPNIIYLLPEFCRTTGLTDSERSNFGMMKALAEYTRLEPGKRIDNLTRFAKRLNECEEAKKELAFWDMNLKEQIIDVPGRILDRENIFNGEKKLLRYDAIDNPNWTRSLCSNPMLMTANVGMWAVICIKSLKRETTSFLEVLRRSAASMNFSLSQPNLYEISDDRPGTYAGFINSLIRSSKLAIIMCIVTNNNRERYCVIKKESFVKNAVLTQIVLQKSICGKRVVSVANKVAVQMNSKLGGIPWAIEIPISKFMVVGYDVCHDTHDRKKAFGAMVTSLNNQCTRYFSVVSPHKSGEELSNCFGVNISKSLAAYKLHNGFLPERILIYRDGVGEGQLQYVHEYEVNEIERNLTEVYGHNKYKFCFIVITKRHKTRLFLNRRNPPPGTVVNDVITLPHRYDFFLVSQKVTEGTVSPTSYNIIRDTMGLNADKLQRLSFKLCHMYYNWSGTVRVPAPCQYAHKLAFLASQCLHTPAHQGLDNKLYYL